MKEKEETSPTPADASSRPWFGYIGFGIVLTAMLLGIVAMVGGVVYLIRWNGR